MPRPRRSVALLAAAAVFASAAGGATAHGPDPIVGGALWAPDEVVGYGWVSGQVPPSWAAVAIDAAAADIGESRASRAATFVRNPTPTSLVAYGEPTGCSAAGIACFDRSGAPDSFRMWFRAHGYAFDWGILRWCQGMATIANGCFDIENIALDELGHVEILGHHVNATDGSDYLDAVVQTVSRARPKAGWDVHALGRCDVARLQLEYERIRPADLFSTCLSVATTLSLGVTDTSILRGETVRFTAVLRAANTAANRALANDPISSRPVLLQRRTVGTTTWSTFATMSPSATTAGSYSTTYAPTATYEWRAAFTTPANEGAVGSTSSTIRVTVSLDCDGGGCPLTAPLER